MPYYQYPPVNSEYTEDVQAMGEPLALIFWVAVGIWLAYTGWNRLEERSAEQRNRGGRRRKRKEQALYDEEE